MAELETNVTNPTETEISAEETTQEQEQEESVEIARLRAELAKAKAATDKATKEAADAKRSLRAKQSAEEIAAEEKKAQDEERDRKLAEYEKRFFVAETAKKVMKLVGDENTADDIAEYLYGAADPDGAIDALNKAWMSKEKALRLELGKIPAPGTGAADGPTITRDQLDAMSYTERNEFARKHPDEYNRLMGRT